MKTKFKLLSVIALLASTMFIQACGPAIDFTPLTKEEVKKLDDAGDKWTKEARDLIQKFGFEQVDMKAVSEAITTHDLLNANNKESIDLEKKVLTAIKAKKDSKELVNLIDNKNDFMDKFVKIDTRNANNTPKGVYLHSLKFIARAGAMITKTKLEDELARVESKADVKLAEQEINAISNTLRSIYMEIYKKLK